MEQILQKIDENSQIKKDISCPEQEISKTFTKTLKKLSTKKIKKHFNSKEIFTFREFKKTEIIKAIKKLPKNKASTFKDIPVKIKANSVHIYSQVLTNIFNDCVKSGNFPNIL